MIISNIATIVLVLGTLGGLFLLFMGGRTNQKNLAIIGGVVSGICVLTIVLSLFSCYSQMDVDKVDSYEAAAGEYIGKELQGKNVLVILGDELPDGDAKIQNKMYEAFKKGFGGEVIEHKIKRISTYGLAKDQAKEVVENYFVELNKIYDDAEKNNCDVIVQFATFSVVTGDENMNKHGFPKNAKLLLMPNSIRLDAPAARKIAEKLFAKKVLYGIIAEKKVNYKEEVPGEVNAAFEKRYVLITPENKDSYTEFWKSPTK